MTGRAAVDVDGDVSDVIAMLTRAFPGWTVTRTDRGVWWAVRGGLTSETLTPNGRSTLRAGTAAELYVLLERAA